MKIEELLESYKEKNYSKFSYNLSTAHNCLEAHVFFDDFEILNILEVDMKHAYYVTYYTPKKRTISYFDLGCRNNLFLDCKYGELYFSENENEYNNMLKDISDHIEYSKKLDIRYKDFLTELDKIYEDLKPIIPIKSTQTLYDLCQKRVDILKDTFGDFLK